MLSPSPMQQEGLLRAFNEFDMLILWLYSPEMVKRLGSSILRDLLQNLFETRIERLIDDSLEKATGSIARRK